METRQLGQSELRVSRIGFGASRIGGFSAAGGSRRASVRLLHEALERGINLFDTADAYARGDSEALLGEAFEGRRDRVVIATKGGYLFSEQILTSGALQPALGVLGKVRSKIKAKVLGNGGDFTRQDFTPAYLRAAVDGSLRRLRTDYIDLYQLHAPRSEQARNEDVISVLLDLQHAGKIRYFGVGLEGLGDVMLWFQRDDLTSIQIPFGLLDLEANDAVLPAAAQAKTALVARGVYGGGLLKEGIPPTRLEHMTPKSSRIQAFHRIARDAGRETRELALHYVLAKPEVSLVLLGMRTSSQLSGNLQLLDRPALDPETVAAIESVNQRVDLNLPDGGVE